MNQRIFALVFVTALFTLASCGADDEATDTRSYLVHTWRCAENSSLFGSQNYDVVINLNPAAEDGVMIYNFFDRKTTVEALVEGNTIILQTVEIDGWSVNGTGVVSADFKSINWNYTVDDGNGNETVTAIFTIKDPVSAAPDTELAR